MTEQDAIDSLMAILESMEVSLKRIADALEFRPIMDEHGDPIEWGKG